MSINANYSLSERKISINVSKYISDFSYDDKNSTISCKTE